MSTYLQGKLRRRTRAPHETAEAGFTLIELLVVIVILGVLSAIVVFSVQGINDKGQDSACDTDKATIATAEEAYYASHNKYGGMDDLEGKFLSTRSQWYGIELVGEGADYKIKPLGTTCS
ncbi:prepilin-type N-terminal cleavage/methylation domain-containing protein [Streptomyces diastatochromogenes]|nr:prepilin-type N-terminal cleavage/methylation domain-containing protein [Streptomyces diastatochromogenes]